MTHALRRLLHCLLALGAVSAVRAGVPAGFQDTVVFSGLDAPTNMEFAPDGRVFAIEKGGSIKVWNGVTDPSPDLLVNLGPNVHDLWDRGMLGLAVDPQFPTRPYIYVLYTYDFDPATPEFPAPRWGDTCPSPPGTTDGCVATGRLSRLQVSPANALVGGEQVLLENNWCIQSVTHTIGDLAFDSAGALLVSGGDGAGYTFVDYGQTGGSPGSPIPRNPCGDPPGGRGGVMTSPTAEGGALRSQDLRTSADPLTWDGTLLRIHPDTGAAWPTNPLIGGASAEDDRVVAYGLRNPFRFTQRPGTNEVWVGDVGWNGWEEIDRILSPQDATVENFGWPCYEGVGRNAGYDAANLNLCETLYSQGPSAVVDPHFQYVHNESAAPGDGACNQGSAAVSGLAFYSATSYPASYQGALFWADYGRGCMFVMPKGGNGLPDPALRQTFLTADTPITDLEIGPGGDLFYVNIATGEIHRISYTAGNTPPTAVAQAAPVFGPLPLTVNFDASASTDPDPGTVLTYAWDLDGDGQYDDSTAVAPQRTYSTAGAVNVRLLVDDGDGGTDIDLVVVHPGNTPPVPSIQQPLANFTWKVGDPIPFAGSATDAQDGSIPAAQLTWDVILHHCPGGTAQCHAHVAQTITGVASGTFVAPDHDWYAYLEFRLRATDAAGQSAEVSRTVEPQSVLYSFHSVPSGLQLLVGSEAATTPFERQAIIGSTLTIGAELTQQLLGVPYRWISWSNGGAVTQSLTVAQVPQSLTANYVNDRILVVAAHPEDDVVTAAGVIERGVQDGAQVQIVYLSNGDQAGGPPTGLVRQDEAVLAEQLLGVDEGNLLFFGYPGEQLDELLSDYPNSNQQLTTTFGQAVTYGQRGLGSADYHSYRFGAPAEYNGYNLIHDLADAIDRFRPAHILTLSSADAASDHAAAYEATVDALQLVFGTDPAYMPALHSTLIWADPPQQTPVWPEPANPSTNFTQVPGLPPSLPWSERESLQVPLSMQITALSANDKWAAIDAHQSQGGAGGFLGRFVHKDEFFWAENVLGPDQPPIADAGPDRVVGNGVQVVLDGSASRDPENAGLEHRWVQVSGPGVTLSSVTAAQPGFTSPPAGTGQVMAFELRVNDGQFESLADAVTVRVSGTAINIAPLSTATASSQTVETGQTASKAIDDVVSGWPADPTREWATDGGHAGSWIQLTWARPYCVDKVILYDRPNSSDRVTGGNLQFSDSSTVAVGALQNAAQGDTFTFAPKVVTTARLNITSVSAATENIGLAEFRVFRCVDGDFDGDDWLVSEGDCDDGDALRNPSRTEQTYNGRDDDCNAATRDNDLDQDGYNLPPDCDDGNATVHLAPVEVAGLRVDPQAGSTARITWSSQQSLSGTSTVYDVISGTLANLRTSGGFGQATCLAGDLSTAQYDDARPAPVPGAGYYYLSRATNSCGAGTFGNARTQPPDPRDALDAAPPCP